MSDAPNAAADAWTVRRVLEWTTQHLKKHGSDTPRLDAEILLAHSRNCPRIALYTHIEDELSEPVRARMRELVQRRAQSEPVAYLVGHREFFSLDFLVSKDVLIPRPDTETLVMAALDAAKQFLSPRPRLGGEGQGEGASAPNDSVVKTTLNILDLCTGSGCVAIAIAKNCPTAHVTATDISPAAIAVATENAAKHAVQDRVQFATGDLFAAIASDATFDIIVSNPPYVTTAELETLAQDIRKYEPRGALDGGPDGLDVVKRIIAEAPNFLKAGGMLFIEISPEQGPEVLRLVNDYACYTAASLMKDLSGKVRLVAARGRA